MEIKLKEQAESNHTKARIKARDMGEKSFSYRFLKIIEAFQDNDSLYKEGLKIFGEIRDYAVKINKYNKIEDIIGEGVSTLNGFRMALPDYCLEKMIEAETLLKTTN